MSVWMGSLDLLSVTRIKIRTLRKTMTIYAPITEEETIRIKESLARTTRANKKCVITPRSKVILPDTNSIRAGRWIKDWME